MQRIWRKKRTDTIYKPPTTAELITRSIYTGNRIIDESKTVTLPTFIRTGDSYFHEKLLHVNAMIEHYGLSSLFLMLSMAEGKWTHLKEILKSTDNGDTLPTNRPLHTTLYFVNLEQNSYGNNQKSANGMNCYTFLKELISKSINNVIDKHIIRSDLP